ncbi:alanyl-tRNA editing protein [Clostridium tarantellae]|uniref:Alanyl-tRNA editing protein AlaX-L n=1 Tax=Clostridium tarantellae TaxID=39493 RepID=A0A6I1MQ20_9CLOT|nr:DHHA1 domain-containing protein [Clostridium tarantellae]MPQ44227.1 alanyl-tRNA editing protein AlaX-L [Clostridium tarantellae]
MDKLYYVDQHIKNFTAEIIDILEIDKKFHIVLDKTAFFPGGGGQPRDFGKIENIEVIDLYEKDGIVYHVVGKKPIKIHRVKCSIDWKRRLDGMTQHFAQHVLSGCFYTLFNANTVSFHMGKDISTVDIEGYLEEEKIRKAEKLANEIIEENIEVEFLTPTKKELRKLNLRRTLPNTENEIRVVKIGDLDINACCGVHPKSTLELRMIKIKKWEKHKKTTRIEFLAGKRAIEDSFNKDIFTNKVCRYLNSNELEVINGIKNINDKLKEANEQNKKLREELSKYQIDEMIDNSDKLNNINIIKKIYENENIKDINKLIGKIIENDNVITLIVIKNNERANIIFACSKNLKNINMNTLLKDSIILIDGKGGGSQVLAQGAGKNNNNINSVIDYAFIKIKNEYIKE